MKSIISWYMTPFSPVELTGVSEERTAKQRDSLLLGLFFDTEDKGFTFLRNVAKFYLTTGCHIAEDSTPCSYRCENLNTACT
jgi:hypothetical protein